MFVASIRFTGHRYVIKFGVFDALTPSPIRPWVAPAMCHAYKLHRSYDDNSLKSSVAKPQNLRTDAVCAYSAYMLRYLSVCILVPYYARILGPATYGQVLAAMSLMALVWMAVNYGFSTTGSRDMALSADEDARGGIFAGQIAARVIADRNFKRPSGPRLPTTFA